MTDECVSNSPTSFQCKVINNIDNVTEGTSNVSPPKKNKSKIRHICQICDREFTKKCGLTNHLLIHAGVKPFICEICYKTFTKKCTLTVHLLTHSSERPHVCEVCEKSFARKTDLQKHRFVHTGEKRYVCDLCDKRFTHQNNLRRHKLKHFPKETKDVEKKKDLRSLLFIDKNNPILTSISKVLKDTVNVKNVHELLNLRNNPIHTNGSKISDELVNRKVLQLSVGNKQIHTGESDESVIRKNVQEALHLLIEADKQFNSSQSENLAELSNRVSVLGPFNCDDERQQNFATESDILKDLVNTNDVLDLSDINVNGSGMVNSKESELIKRSMEIKDIYNSLSIGSDGNGQIPVSEFENGTLDNINSSESLSIVDLSLEQMTIETKVLNELIKLKDAEESFQVNSNSNGKALFSKSDVLEKAIEKKDLCQSLSVDNDLEQAIAVTSDVIKESANDQSSSVDNDLGKAIAIAADVMKESANDIQMLLPIDDNVHPIASEPHLLKVIAKKIQALDTLTGVIEATENDLQLHIENNDVQLSLCTDNNDPIISESDVIQAVNSGKNKEIPLEKDFSITQEPFSCNVCGELFDSQKLLLIHVSSHVNDDQFKCYLCDSEFDNDDLLQEHILTHDEDDIDNISLDDDFTKFGPLTPGEISLEDIDKIGLDDEDFDEEVARMYALAHVETSLNGNDSESVDLDDDDDDATKLYSFSQAFSVKEIDSINESTDCNHENSNFPAEIPVKNCSKVFCDSETNNLIPAAMKIPQQQKIGLDDTLLNSSKFNILKRMQIQAENADITASNINNNFIEKNSKLHSARKSELSMKNIVASSVIDSFTDSISNLNELKKVDFHKDLRHVESDNAVTDNFSNTNYFSRVENFDENFNRVTINDDDIIDKVNALLHANTTGKFIDKNCTDVNSDPTSSKLKPFGTEDININENSSNSSIADNLSFDINKKPFICHFCDKIFTRRLYLHTHYLMHAGIKPFKCEVCSKSFTKKHSLTVHSLIHTGERKHACSECEKTFSRKTDLQKHRLIHTGQKPFVCEICDKAFNHQNNLRRHKRSHFNKKPFVCYICSAAFTERVSLLSHVKIHIKEAELKGVKGKLSASVSNCLKSIKEKLYECDVCGTLFARHDRLLKHKLTHTVRNLYLCEFCGCTFAKKDQLQLHLSNHNDNAFDNIKDNGGSLDDLDLTVLEPSVQNTQKTHTCDQCFKVYTRSSALKCHYLTHTGEKPHKCHLCQKGFAQRTNLKRHILSHSGIKPFTCDICKKSFARKPYLRKHYLSHSSDELFTFLGSITDV